MTAGQRAALMVAMVAVPPAVIVAAIGALGGPVIGAVLFVVIAVAVSAWVWVGAERRVLGPLAGHDADALQQARAINLIEGLSPIAGVHPPGLTVVESDGLNVAVVGRDRDSTTVVATSALLAEMTRIELEGVLAAALVEIRNGELRPATIAASLPWLGRRLVTSAAGRDSATDAAAAGLTRFPPGLASALDKMGSKGTKVNGASPDQAHLWLADPVGSDAAEVGRTPLRDRAEALREL